MSTQSAHVIVGVDTHADTHHVAVIDTNGTRIADAKFLTTLAGLAALVAFVRSHGTVIRVGVEGTGSYGAGLSRYLRDEGFTVVEVIRPNRQVRRMRGKSDPIDAYEAARTALAEPDLPTPKTADGNVEAIRALLVARRSAIKARTAAQTQIKSLLVTAPTLVRERFRGLTDKKLLPALSALRPSRSGDEQAAAMLTALRSLARRHAYLSEEIADLDQLLNVLVSEVSPALRAAKGVGTVTAAQLLVTAGDNPERLRSEASFAALCGVSPIPASSGKTNRHRLNRGGDRQANSALHQIVLSRMTYDSRTRDYVARKRAEGRGAKEAMRCLKRAVAREVFRHLTRPEPVPVVNDLRPLRLKAGLRLSDVAERFGCWPMKVSTIERGVSRDDEFAAAYREWLISA